ncbi:hypothetical protein [Pseudomonas sp. JG-B]|uniref:hypothetical protein n=1 Tax=Pseudomonas sp. JG-B TaxID=2603214 RepID=UPI00129D7B52|nr:hypothetical protein [Pseudomonas sp. JG-B]MRK19102.1 hypothetical protein [Pseudomonas sp. JG-B]
MTRAVTLVARSQGYQDTLHVGRVSNAICGLVVRRDLAHESHEKTCYWQVSGTFQLGGIEVPARYKLKDSDPYMEVGNRKELSSEDHANGLASSVRRASRL